MIGARAVLFIGDRRRGAAGNYGAVDRGERGDPRSGRSLTCRRWRVRERRKLEQGRGEAVPEYIEVGHGGAIDV